MAITLKQYWHGRDVDFAAELTPSMRANATETVRRVNMFLATYHSDNPDAAHDNVNSGWRPSAVNATVKGASSKSAHLTAEAVDLADDNEAIDAWIKSAAGRYALVDCDLYAEVASATPRWAHLQIRATKSGNRVFFP